MSPAIAAAAISAVAPVVAEKIVDAVSSGDSSGSVGEGAAPRRKKKKDASGAKEPSGAPAAEAGAKPKPKKSWFARNRRGILGGIGSVAGFTVAPMVLDRLLNGSPEQQQIRAFQLQRRLEQEEAAAGGGGGFDPFGDGDYGDDGASLRTLDDRLATATSMRRASDIMDPRFQSAPSGQDELDALIAQDEMRLRSLQDQQTYSHDYLMRALGG